MPSAHLQRTFEVNCFKKNLFACKRASLTLQYAKFREPVLFEVKVLQQLSFSLRVKFMLLFGHYRNNSTDYGCSVGRLNSSNFKDILVD